MRLYLASSSKGSNLNRVKKTAEIFEKNGHTVHDKWWEYYLSGKVDKLKKMSDSFWFKHQVVRGNCERDFKEISDCEVFVVLAGSKVRLRGANVELGYALALKKPCVSIGMLERCTMYVPVVKVGSVFDAIKYLEIISGSSDTLSNQEYRSGES